MNFGLIVRNSLQRASLPFDIEHLEIGKSYANDNIDSLWNMVKSDFKQSRSQITTVANSDEYVLNKLFDKFVPNTMRGPSTNPRILIYKDPTEFFRITRNYPNSTGNPTIFTFGDFSGVDNQLTVPSQIQVYSSLANKTTGTVNVKAQSQTVIGIGTAFSLNDVGLNFQVTGDTAVYKIAQYISPTQIVLETPYGGQTNAAATYAAGDVGVHCSVQGYVGGEIDSEDVILNGENVVQTAKLFSTLTSCSKSDFTGGRTIFRNTANTINVAILAPGEFEIERQTVKFWRIPSSVETLSFRFYMKHPDLRLDSDRSLIPSKYHSLIQKMTEADLKEFYGTQLGQKLTDDISRGKEEFYNDANDTSLWNTILQEEGSGTGQPQDASKIVDSDFLFV